MSTPSDHTELSHLTACDITDSVETRVKCRRSTYYGLTQKEFDTRYGRRAQKIETCLNVLLSLVTYIGRTVVEAVKHSIPIVNVVKTYRIREYILGDIVSGLSLGVMTIPQSFGYALLASVPPVLGLYTSLFPVIIYFFFATSRHVSIGTMALSSLIIGHAVNRGMALFKESVKGDRAGGFTDSMSENYTDPIVTLQGLSVTGVGKEFLSVTGVGAEIVHLASDEERISIAISVSFLAGLILVAMSICRLGFTVTYMSEAFISGYLASSNLRVLTLQARVILGVPYVDRTKVKVGEYFYLVYDILSYLGHTNLIQLGMSVLTIIILVTVKKCINERFQARLKVPIPIDFIAIIIATLASHFFSLHERFGVKILKEIKSGIPPPVIPSIDHMTTYAFDAVMLAVVSFMLVAMMAKLFAERHGYQVDNNQELLANGLCCIGGSFFRSLASSTSPPRCFLMESTGGRTQFAHLVSAIVILITLLFAAELFHSLPLCILACIVIVACIPLFVHYRAWITYYTTDKYDLAVWIVTAAATLIFTVDIALVVGISFTLVIVHFRMQRPYSTTLVTTDLANNRSKSQMTMTQNHGSNGDVATIVSDTDDFIFVDECLYKAPVWLSRQPRHVVFRFESPLYFATLDVFKEKILEIVSASGAKTASKNDDEMHWVVKPQTNNVENHEVAKDEKEEAVGEEDGGDVRRTNELNDVRVTLSEIGEITLDQSNLHGTAYNSSLSQANQKSSNLAILPQIGNNNGGAEDSQKDGKDCCQSVMKGGLMLKSLVVILDMSAVSFMDTGGAKLLGRMHGEYSKKPEIRLILAGCCSEVIARLHAVESCAELVASSLYPSVQDAVVAVTD